MELDRLIVPVLPDMDRFGPALNRGVDSASRRAGGTAGKGFSSGFKAGPVAAGVLIADVLRRAAQGAVNFFKEGWAEAEEARKVTAQTAAAIKSTGGAAHVTQSDVDRLSTALMHKTKIDDEVITSGQNMLLTFTRVRNEAGKGNDIFNQATQAGLDLAKATGKDVVGANVMLGKALNDPVRGLTALTRVGVTFDEGQRKQIKSMQEAGNITGAQKIILAELRKEFGGSAAAQATLTDSFKVWYGNVKEAAGAGLQRAFQAIQPPIQAIGRIGAAVFKGLSRDIGGTKGVWETFAQFLEVHQTEIVTGFVEGGKAGLALGQALLQMASWGLRAAGTVDQAISRMVDNMLDDVGGLIRGLAHAFDWVPGLGPKLAKASGDYDAWAAHAKLANDSQGKGALAAADKFQRWADVAKNTRDRLDEVGKKEIFKAEQRDAARKSSIAIEDIGKKGDYARLKLEGYNLESGRGSKAQKDLAARIHAARDRMIEQWTQGERNNVSQRELTKRWDQGKEALRREFIQMGYSDKAAKDLAERYGKIPRHIQVKHTTPGAAQAIESAKELKRRIDGIKDKSVSLEMKFQASATKAAVQFFKTVPGSEASGFVNTFRREGGPLPGYSAGDRSDNTIYAGTPGEWVIQRPTVRKYGNAGMRAINEGRVPKEVLAQYANGGEVFRNITTRYARNGIPGAVGRFGPAGFAGASELGSDAVKMLAKLALAQMQGAGSGIIGGGGFAAGLKWARAQEGKPYRYPLVGPNAYDCSGFVSALINVVKGKKHPYTRLFSTSMAGGRTLAGLTRNKRSALEIGVVHGNPGHTGATINGVEAESSGGRGVRVGPEARGAHDRLFNMHYGLARGGRVGDLPFDRLDPRGRLYDPWLAAMLREGKGPGLATGGRFETDGWARVGERGAEIIYGRKGDRVVPETHRSSTITIHLHQDGLVSTVQGILDEHDEFHASVGRMTH